MKKKRQKMIASAMGRRIQARMAEMGIDFHDLARMADVSHGCAKGSGKHPDPHPTAEYLGRVAAAL